IDDQNIPEVTCFGTAISLLPRAARAVDADPKPEVAPPPSRAARSFRNTAWVTFSFVAIVAAGLWLTRDGGALPPPRVVPLTTLTGFETMPAFSPDGKQVAFVWTGDKQFNQDVYVKVVGDDRVLRLTTDPATDWFPA